MHEMYSSKVNSDGQYIVRGQTHTVFGAPDVLLASFLMILANRFYASVFPCLCFCKVFSILSENLVHKLKVQNLIRIFDNRN